MGEEEGEGTSSREDSPSKGTETLMLAACGGKSVPDSTVTCLALSYSPLSCLLEAPPICEGELSHCNKDLSIPTPTSIQYLKAQRHDFLFFLLALGTQSPSLDRLVSQALSISVLHHSQGHCTQVRGEAGSPPCPRCRQKGRWKEILGEMCPLS